MIATRVPAPERADAYYMSRKMVPITDRTNPTKASWLSVREHEWICFLINRDLNSYLLNAVPHAANHTLAWGSCYCCWLQKLNGYLSIYSKEEDSNHQGHPGDEENNGFIYLKASKDQASNFQSSCGYLPLLLHKVTLGGSLFPRQEVYYAMHNNKVYLESPLVDHFSQVCCLSN